MGLLDQFTQAVDARKRYYGNIVRGLLDNPQALMEQLRAQNAENVTERARASQETQSVMPGIAEPAKQAAFDEAMNMGLLGITVYHGSPHQFDKFDMSKIGTGEGAQAYGHGLYFAENPGVADAYAGMLSPMPVLKKNGEVFNAQSYIEMLAEARALGAGSVQKAIDAQNRKLAAAPKDGSGMAVLEDAGRTTADERAILDALSRLQEYEVRKGGNLYKVDIPDEAVARMLDWDKPLSQQPEAVKKALRSSSFAPDESVWQHYTGRQLYEGEANAIGPYNADGWPVKKAHESVSKLLRDAGIPGIRYLDAGSRGKGGTSNFVLFDDSLPKIIGRE